MKKKHAVLLAGVAVTLAVAAPTAMAAELPELPGLPALPSLTGDAEPNGATCEATDGEAVAGSEGTDSGDLVIQQPIAGGGDGTEGNCVSTGNGQFNNMNSFPGLPSSPGVPQ